MTRAHVLHLNHGVRLTAPGALRAVILAFYNGMAPHTCHGCGGSGRLTPQRSPMDSDLADDDPMPAFPQEPEKWGPADCPRCDGRPWLRDELCPACEEVIAASDPVGPFPQEPAFGSPEAVEQAAETIQGFTPGPLTAQQGDPEPCIVLKGSRPVAFVSGLGNARLFAAAPDLLCERDALRREVAYLKGQRQLDGVAQDRTVASRREVERERDALREENERLQAELRHSTVQHVAMQTELERVRAEVDQLRAGVTSWKAEEESWRREFAQHRAEIQGLGDALEAVTRQRDALANSLEEFYEYGYDRGKAEAALRLVGRLSEVADGPNS